MSDCIDSSASSCDTVLSTLALWWECWACLSDGMWSLWINHKQVFNHKIDWADSAISSESWSEWRLFLWWCPSEFRPYIKCSDTDCKCIASSDSSLIYTWIKTRHTCWEAVLQWDEQWVHWDTAACRSSVCLFSKKLWQLCVSHCWRSSSQHHQCKLSALNSRSFVCLFTSFSSSLHSATIWMCFFLRCRSAGWENNSNDECSVSTHNMTLQSHKCSSDAESSKADTADSFWIQYSIWHRIVNWAKSVPRQEPEHLTADLSWMLLYDHKIAAVSDESYRWSQTVDHSASVWTVWKNSIWEQCTDKTREWKALELIFWLCSMCIHQHQHCCSQTDLPTLRFTSSSRWRWKI